MDFALIRRTWRLFAAYHKYFYVSLAVLLIQEFMVLLPGYIWGKAVNLLVAKENLRMFIILNASIMAIKTFAKLTEDIRDRYEKKYIDFEVPRYARMKVLGHLTESISLGTLRGQHSGLTHSVIQAGESSLSMLMSSMLFRLFPNVVGTIITSAMMLAIDWKLGVIALLGTSLFTGTVYAVNRSYKKLQEEANEQRNSLSKFYSDVLRYLPLVKIFSKEKEMMCEIDSESRAVDEFRKKYQTAKRSRQRAAWIFIFASTTLIYFIAGERIYAGTMSVGTIVMFMSWAGSLQGYFQDLSNINTEFADMMPAIGKYFKIFDLTEKPKVGAHAAKRYSGDIELRDVTFSYPEVKTLEDEDD